MYFLNGGLPRINQYIHSIAVTRQKHILQILDMQFLSKGDIQTQHFRNISHFNCLFLGLNHNVRIFSKKYIKKKWANIF